MPADDPNAEPDSEPIEYSDPGSDPATDTGDRSGGASGTDDGDAGGGADSGNDTGTDSEAATDVDAGADDGGSEADDGGSEADSNDDGAADPTSISSIDRIRLDPEEVVQVLAYNGREDVGRKGKAVFSFRPPFDGTVEPTVRHLDEDSTEGKADDEIHMRPFRFVVEGRQVIEQRPTRQLALEKLGAEEPSEAAIEAWIDEAMVAWKDHVRENLTESVDIFSSHGMAIVDVEFEAGDGESGT